MAVIIYTTPTCVYCKATKKFFAEHNVQYTEHNVAENEAALDEMVEKTGQMGVPVIDVNGKIVVGFNRTKLAELLSIPA